MQKNDYLWKGVLEDVFDDFLRFMHPEADTIFDFEKGISFLDKELEQLFPVEEEDDFSVKIVDKLAKVYTCGGIEEWVLIHCEVQAKYSPDFPKRMFTYFYRILDKYNKRISAYAILTENNLKVRPDRFELEFLDTKQVYCYKMYKIMQQSETELLKPPSIPPKGGSWCNLHQLQVSAPLSPPLRGGWEGLKRHRPDGN